MSVFVNLVNFMKLERLNMNPKEILMGFAQYGVQKTSMEDIAKRAGLSRQSIYKRFGSKDGVLEWALTSYINQVYEAGTNALKELSSCDPKQTVLTAFVHWIGDGVPLIKTTAHGAEILDSGIKLAQESSTDWEGDFMRMLSGFIASSGLTDSMEDAIERSFVLHVASKGVLLKSQTVEEFSEGMKRVIYIVFR